MYFDNLSNLLTIIIDLFACYYGLGPRHNGSCHCGFSWLLLHCAQVSHQRKGPQHAWQCSAPDPPRAGGFQGCWCSYSFLTTLSTCHGPLPHINQNIQGTKWPLFIHHRISAYQGSEGAMEPLKSIRGAQSNVAHQSTIGQTHGSTLGILIEGYVGWLVIIARERRYCCVGRPKWRWGRWFSGSWGRQIWLWCSIS